MRPLQNIYQRKLLFIPLILISLVITTSVLHQQTQTVQHAASLQPIGPTGTWNLIFDDEFNGISLDSTKWATSWFGGGTMNNVSTNPANVSVSGGYLILTLSSSSVGALVSTNPHGGANPGFEFTYGYAEAGIEFPGTGGTIYNWPAWWTDGQSWPSNGEIDIAEGLGTLTSNYHSSNGANNSSTIPGTWSGGFHSYGVDRTPGMNYIYWDGKLIRSYATQDNGAPEYLILNVGSNGSSVTGTASEVKTDYVRVWQRTNGTTTVPTPIPSPTIKSAQIITTAPTVIKTPNSNSLPSTTFSLNLLLDGIGKAGDNANRQGLGNFSPYYKQRAIYLAFYNSQNQLITTVQSTITFNPVDGDFIGTASVAGLAAGNYIVKVKSDRYITSQIAGIINTTPGVTIQLPQTRLIVGDINGDNKINILDYNLLMNCYSDFLPAKQCTTQNKIFSDLTDDTYVNQLDYNLFIRELTNYPGQI